MRVNLSKESRTIENQYSRPVLVNNDYLLSTNEEKIISLLMKRGVQSQDLTFSSFDTIFKVLPYSEPINRLTRREFDCFCSLARGGSVKRIAQRLSLSTRTVEMHLIGIKNKMGICHKSELSEKASEWLLSNQFFIINILTKELGKRMECGKEIGVI